MRYILRHFEKYPVPMMKVFASSNNLEGLQRLDYESTQLIDTETGEIISDFGHRSELYGKRGT